MTMIKSPKDKIEFNNIANYLGVKHGEDWFDWMIYVDEESKILDQIESVEYLLHPSFPNPLRTKTNKEENFALKSSGWGEFDLRITVFFKNGSRTETSYHLDLSKKWNPNLFRNK